MAEVKYKLGDKVKFSKCLRKYGNRYEELEYEGQGIIVGVRTLQEGHFEQEYEDHYRVGPKYWVNDNAIPVYLVAINLKSFEKVKKEDLTLI